ncbi:MAG: CstA-like transporter-associated (seleno)protein [Gemmatimonadales bacterium]
MAGMPDYQTYLEHLRSSHPEQPVLTAREYYSVYVSSRYGDGPTRCC